MHFALIVAFVPQSLSAIVLVSGICAWIGFPRREARCCRSAGIPKIVEHPGIVVNEPIGVLAHLNLGRAYAMDGDTAKSKAEYQDFLTLWKDADPDIPILKQAKAEYAKLQ